MTAPDYQAGQDIDLDPWRVMGSPIQTYTPVLLATTTNPTLGIGSIQEGWWAQANRLIAFWGRIRFGTSGTNPGSGTYRVTGPTEASALVAASGSLGAGVSAGRAGMRDNSNVTVGSRSATLQLVSPNSGPSGESTFLLAVLDGTNVTASNNTPFTWSTEDSISFSGFYPMD